MKIINPSVEILTPIDGDWVLKHIERCGRVAYKSQDKIAAGSAEKLIRHFIKLGHESVLEHFSFTVKFTVDRGISHEIVRHRMASYTQESTRYCNYSIDKFGNEITVIRPCFFEPGDAVYDEWVLACYKAEAGYFKLLELGAKPEQARAVLPNSLKTELVMTANLREWRHFLKLRTAKDAHPQIREVALMLLDKLHDAIPVVFDDIYEKLHAVSE